MAVCIRAKRVTDPLDERVRARLRGEMTDYASSGSEHGSATTDVDEQSCFSGLVNAFLETGVEDDEVDGGESDSDVGSGCAAFMERAAAHAEKLHELLEPATEDPFRIRLRSEVAAAATAAASMGFSGSGLRRAVMARLRERGYNAGICKARWEKDGGLTAGRFEYIDVVESAEDVAEGEVRYIVDLAFAAEFEVVRSTEEYGKVVAALPQVAVARPEEVQAAVRIASKAARRSLKCRGLSVPPWRKKRYMMAKWMGPYRRTVNAIPMAMSSGVGGGEVMRRAVGFGLGGSAECRRCWTRGGHDGNLVLEEDTNLW